VPQRSGWASAHVIRDGFSYRLLLFREAGAELEVFARGVTLAL
jgi:hypothetical protein